MKSGERADTTTIIMVITTITGTDGSAADKGGPPLAVP